MQNLQPKKIFIRAGYLYTTQRTQHSYILYHPFSSSHRLFEFLKTPMWSLNLFQIAITLHDVME